MIDNKRMQVIEALRSGKLENLLIDLGDAQYIAKDSKELRRVAMDSEVAASWNTTSSGVPQVFTIAWTNEIIEQVTQKYAFTEIAPDYQQGSFETTNINFPTLAYSGDIARYGDFSKDGQSNANANWEIRDVFQMQTTVAYGELAVARWGAAKLDYIASQRKGAALAIAQKTNDIGFNGVSGQATYGLLNDPDLASAIALPDSAADPSSSKWQYKTFEEIVKDVLLMWNDIVERASNNLNIGDISQSMILATTPQDQTYLLQPNTYGRTAFEYLRAVFPGLKLVSAIQYLVGDGTSGNKAQLILDRVANQPVVRNAFTYQLMVHNLVQDSTYAYQKMSAGVAGAAITCPIGISTATGV